MALGHYCYVSCRLVRHAEQNGHVIYRLLEILRIDHNLDNYHNTFTIYGNKTPNSILPQGYRQ